MHMKRVGLLGESKVPTDPADLFTSVVKGLEAVTAGVGPRNIRTPPEPAQTERRRSR